MTCCLCTFETSKLDTNLAAVCNKGPCQICRAVTDVEEEINQVVATLQRLIAKRRYLLSEHNRVHDTLINSLPAELKNYIFELLLPSRDEWGEIPATGTNEMSTFLASISICKGWRNIALSNPFLWTSMHISPRTPILSWIPLSGTLPLTLHIQGTDHDQEWSRKVLTHLMSHYSDRLQSLSLGSPVPVTSGAQHDNFQYHRLKRLRIMIPSGLDDVEFNKPLSFLNPTASPEMIEIESVSIRCLQISWNRLTSATVEDLDLEDLTQLFQHASQMTHCEILLLRRSPDIDNYSMPPIIHHGLKTLLCSAQEWELAPILLGSLTLPCLQKLIIDETVLLTLLPALVHRSSCPLTKLTLSHDFRCGDELSLDKFQPLTGVTDLVVGDMEKEPAVIQGLLLNGYFPDLRHLTLRFQPFMELWDIGFISLLLDLKRPRPGEPNEGKLHKFLVVDEDSVPRFHLMWNSDVGKELKALNIGLRKDGFEFF